MRKIKLKTKEERRIEQLEQENTTNMLAMVEVYEENIRLKEDNTNTMLALTEVYEKMVGGNV